MTRAIETKHYNERIFVKKKVRNVSKRIFLYYKLLARKKQQKGKNQLEQNFSERFEILEVNDNLAMSDIISSNYE